DDHMTGPADGATAAFGDDPFHAFLPGALHHRQSLVDIERDRRRAGLVVEYDLHPNHLPIVVVVSSRRPSANSLGLPKVSTATSAPRRARRTTNPPSPDSVTLSVTSPSASTTPAIRSCVPTCSDQNVS